MTHAPSGRIRFGVVGCGGIAYWAHLRNLRRLRHAALVAAADPDPGARERARRLTGLIPHADANELLARDDVDAVVVCAPSHLHAELAIAACEAGKHLYLEKPIATDAEGSAAVVAAGARAAVTAVMGFNRRVHPALERARRIVAGGRIGRVLAVQSTFCELAPPGGMPAWKRDRATGGGVLLDLGSHHVDLVRWILNAEVEAAEARIASEASEADTAWLRLTMTGGTVVESFFSFRASHADHLVLLGEAGSLRVDRLRGDLDLRVRREARYGNRKAWLLPTSATLGARLRRRVLRVADPSYRLALDAFREEIGGGPRRLATLEDGARSLAAILAAERR